MGKSTMLNLLVGPQLRTGALSSDGRHGRQTTTSTHWFAFGDGGAVIDSPGFHEFGIAHVSATSLVEWMPDFAAADGGCRFANCRHAEEPDCAIRAAVAAGAISAERYAFYRKLLAQSATAAL
jgi:ribosome biogenesis GTPase